MRFFIITIATCIFLLSSCAVALPAPQDYAQWTTDGMDSTPAAACQAGGCFSTSNENMLLNGKPRYASQVGPNDSADTSSQDLVRRDDLVPEMKYALHQNQARLHFQRAVELRDHDANIHEMLPTARTPAHINTLNTISRDYQQRAEASERQVVGHAVAARRIRLLINEAADHAAMARECHQDADNHRMNRIIEFLRTGQMGDSVRREQEARVNARFHEGVAAELRDRAKNYRDPHLVNI